MTEEELKKRLQAIEQLMQQALANFNMLEGGKQECLYWLEQIKLSKSN